MRLFCILTGVLSVVNWTEAQVPAGEVSSPNGHIHIAVSTGTQLTYRVSYKGTIIINDSPIGMELEDRTLGSFPKVKSSNTSSHRGILELPYGNAKTLRDEYNETEITFEGNYGIILRAYDDGVAYRFTTDLPGLITVVNERTAVVPEGSYAVQFPETDSYTTWEVPYKSYANVAAISQGKRAITPVLLNSEKISVVIGESDVRDYPGMYLQKDGNGFGGVWAHYPKRTALGSWGNFVSVVKETEPFIARTDGKRKFPWRVFIPTDKGATLLDNKLIFKLASPLAIKDVSWIKPGKATWEWWHDAIVEDAAIPSGMANRNTALYKHYIDFAAANNLEYLMLDAGWSDIFDLSKINSKNDIHELIRYGKEKKVGIFLWCVATTLMDDLDHYMEMLQSWGVVGLKVDFIDRDDQLAITWFEKIATSAAKHQLMVNFHGCSKPTGLERAYPNIVNYEAVRGAECSKWDFTANPDHHVTVLFSRLLAGPLDYTPGSMRNSTQENFKPVDPGLPSTQGTRCHELAMYILFEQPFAMLCDSPTEYRKYPDIMQYLSVVPTAFDETRVLEAKVNQFAVIAKRKGNAWYVGAMTNWTERDIVVDFSFLLKGKWKAVVYQDGKSSEPQSYLNTSLTVDRKTKMNIHLAKGGGAVIQIYP